MKKITLSLFFLIPLMVLSQFTTNNPDTVCNGSSIYQVTSLGAGYTYNWTVYATGAILSGQGTNSITVNWSNANAGLIPNAVSVVATNTTTGCQSTPVNVNVFILNITPSITQLGPFCSSQPCVNLTGSPTGGVFTGSGISGTQFCPSSAQSGNNLITYTVTQAGCQFTAQSLIVVNTSPTLQPISHD